MSIENAFTYPTTIEFIGTILFALAVMHTFLVQKIAGLSRFFPKESLWYSFFHMMGEIEIVFGLWASLFFVAYVVLEGGAAAIQYQQSLHFTEPLFVFCIMTICATRPIMTATRQAIMVTSWGLQKTFKIPAIYADLLIVLSVGPLSGSFITEPAAMTVSALMLNSMIKENHLKILYFMIATLFVNISIGGTLTTYAAPPVLMVAQQWGWTTEFIIANIGWKAAVAVFINALIFILFFRSQIKNVFYTLEQVQQRLDSAQAEMPVGVMMVHLLFLALVVVTSHYTNVFMGIFLLFLGLTMITKRYQDSLRLRESLLVAFFLGGIIVFGSFQKWWLAPILENLSDSYLYVSSLFLTAITDNAALTYLGSQVESLSEISKIALVAGAVTGGGLTVIANAPNPAGYAIFHHRFEGGVINPIRLFLYALMPTSVAAICLWII